MESLYDLYKRSSASVVKDGYIRKEDLHFALCRKGNKRNLFVDRLKVMVLAILTESNMKLSNDVVEIIVDKVCVVFQTQIIRLKKKILGIRYSHVLVLESLTNICGSRH
ncbi:uncharacterized protein LOC129290234 isoform X1 [Prosopis cineraria]|uniref:uncharacterized protein LOC129290234 isoform X1 n=1 Tax=Prosopis cineraria TaxID=364024 RepID=UPI00240F5FDA|nr:uncharacterized protein LOC129290234 isoform X1 [Prosopis cineraria]